MTHQRLSVATGSGRLIRTAKYIALSMEPIDGLYQAIGTAGPDAFKQLAGLIVARNFEVAPFVVLTLDDPALFVFGDLAVQHDDEVIDGSSTTTWVERKLSTFDVIVCTAPGAVILDDTDLVVGCVGAGGFLFGNPATPTTTPTTAEDIGDTDDAIGAGDDLEAEEVAHEVLEAEEVAIEGHPPVAAEASASTVAAALPSEPTSVVMRLDDGQVIMVNTGAYIGRNPTKNGLPPGYGGIVVRGEHVSRVHWELCCDGADLTVRDLGSASGTEVQQADDSGRTSVPPNGSIPVKVGATIHFADRWAVLEDA